MFGFDLGDINEDANTHIKVAALWYDVPTAKKLLDSYDSFKSLKDCAIMLVELLAFVRIYSNSKFAVLSEQELLARLRASYGNDSWSLDKLVCFNKAP
jgi:uncharacterized ferritin-like protein (DUF455 family)